MAPVYKLPTADLRSEAKEYQRDRNHNAKWARGFAPAPGKVCPHLASGSAACNECAARPQNAERGYRRYKGPGLQKVSMPRKWGLNNSDDNLTIHSDSSAGEEEVKDASAAPVPDADIMYSYDAPRGPGRGNDILSSAITQAVERYENKVTEKLVKEYDFVDDGKDRGDGYAADADEDEDDFELIDHASLD